MKFNFKKDSIDFLNDFFIIGSQYVIKDQKHPVILLIKEESYFSYYIKYLCIGIDDKATLEDMHYNPKIFIEMIDCGDIYKI